MLTILEALLKWEDKLLGYCIHVVMDHKALEFFQSTLNKVVDALSRYYEHDYWTSVPELHDYINTDIRLDPEHNDLPREQVFEIEEQVIETRV